MSIEENFEMVSRLITNLEKRPLLEESMDPKYLVLSKKSTKQEVDMWLQEEGFLIARDKLKGISGKELYSTSKEELRKIIGFAESARLFSRLLKEKELLPAGEQTIKESDFERFMRIRREDVDSRIPSPNPITSFDVPAPPKPTRPMIREVFTEPQESLKYVEKVKKSKDKPVESKKPHAKHREEKKERKERESPRSTESESSGDERRRRRHHKHSKEKKARDKEEPKVRKDKHKRLHKSKQSPQERVSESESETASGSEAPPQTPPKRSRHKNRKRREKEGARSQEKEKKKEEQTEPVSPPPVPLPPQHQYPDPLRPQMSPYGPVQQILPRALPPQYPPPFPDPYTSQLMMQQAQIARAEQDRFAAEMRLRQLKSGFSAPGAMAFPPAMPHFQNF